MERATTPAAAAHAVKPSATRGWPALAVAFIVLGAAVYSFSPRPAPPFKPTQIHPDKVIVNGLAMRGTRLIAAAENGVILIADDPAGPWTQATIEPPRGSSLNQVAFVDGLAIAVGHDSWILRSEDGGKTWKEALFDGEKSLPVMGVAGPFDGKLYAFGAFGQFLVSTDNGATWTPEVHEALGDRHLNAMTQAADGSLLLVGERGLLAKSTDRGATWTVLPEIYPGSFFGVLSLPSKALLAFGMRGHVYRSEDFGTSWQESRVPTTTSLFSGVVAAPQQVVLAGAGNAVLVSNDDGRSFALATESARYSIADLLPLDRGVWLTASDGGIEIKKSGRASAAGDAS